MVCKETDGSRYCERSDCEVRIWTVPNLEQGETITISGSPPKPTRFPTLSPTPKPTNPAKPIFNEAEFQAKQSAFSTVAAVTETTRRPTPAPTSPPTFNGYEVVKKQVKRKAVQAAMSFAITKDEAQNPVMQEALTTGVAASLGLQPESVKILSINGQSLSRRRLTSVSIEFQITSNSDDTAAADQLKTDLETAAAEGSVVANVQEAANDRDVLVQSLYDMPLKMNTPAVAVLEVEVEVLEQIRTTGAPTFSPNGPPAESFNASESTIVSHTALVLVILCTLLIVQYRA